MANEDFTTWTEVDEATYLSVTSSRVTFAGYPATLDTTCVYKDLGAGFYSGDFKFRIGPIEVTDASSTNARIYLFSVSLTLPGSGAQQSGRLGIRWTYDTAYRLELAYNAAANNSTTADASDLTSFALDTPVYVEVERASGVVTAKIYSDAYSTLVDTLSITPAVTSAYRYACAASSYRIGSGATIGGYVENVDLDPSPPAITKLKLLAHPSSGSAGSAMGVSYGRGN